MITLTTEQAQQIEEALEDIVRVFKFETGTPVEALDVIRAARAHEQATVSGGLCGGCAKKAADGWALYCVECWEKAEQEPLMDYERINALREGEQNGAEDAYFFVRPENDTPSLRKMFCQGFERGFHKGLKYAAPVSIHSESETDSSSSSMRTTVRTKDLTDEEIQNAMMPIEPTGKDYFLRLARAVIAADRRKNK